MIYIILFLLSFVLTYFIKEHALKNALVAEVNERSSHTTPTPHGGGIAIALTWFVGITYLYLQNQMNTQLYSALMVGMLISGVSYLDDLYELSAKVRLVAQAVVACLGLYFLGGFGEFNLFFITIENSFFNNIFAFFMIIWFINLYNFLDGIDGYAGSEALFLALAGYMLFGGEHFLVLAAAVFGFLLWNWHRAKIFMGDVGSTLLGYNVAIFTIYYANASSVDFWVWIVLFGLFWFDATLTLVRRFKNNESLSMPHKKHAYQRLHQSGYPHDKVVFLAMGINFVLFSLVWLLKDGVVLLFLSLVVLYSVMKFVDKKKEFI